jgi:WD40 repeat protein
VRVLKYPCVEEGSDALICSGHSSHVMNVRWTVADEFLISCGGNDKAVFQWRHSMIATDTGRSGGGSGSSPAGGMESHLENDRPDSSANNAISTTDLEEPSGGDEFMAVKPWKGAIRAPDNPPPINSSIPSATLQINWVHGYTSGAAGASDSRVSSNLFYNATGDIVYPAAALGVCLHPDAENPLEKSQKYFHAHDDDILCLAISPCKRFVATGNCICALQMYYFCVLTTINWIFRSNSI